MNTATMIIGGLVLAAVVAALWKIRKDKKNHKHSCGGDCGSCGGCH